jgi:ribosomal protein S4
MNIRTDDVQEVGEEIVGDLEVEREVDQEDIEIEVVGEIRDIEDIEIGEEIIVKYFVY